MSSSEGAAGTAPEGTAENLAREPEFALAVHHALRNFNRADRLRHNPLITSCLVKAALGKSPTAPPTQALRELIRTHCAEIGQNQKYGRYQQVLQQTYFAPLRGQRAVAEALHLSWGSYRRYLNEARAMLTVSLSEAECNLQGTAGSAAAAITRTRARRRAWLAAPAGMLALAILIAGIFLAFLHRKTQTPPSAPATTSLAVMPFVNLTPKSDDPNTSNEITSAVISRLGQMPNVQVMAQPLSFRPQAGMLDARHASRIPRVNWVIEGSTQDIGGLLRVNIELVNPVNGYELWSDQITAPQAQILQLEDNLSTAVTLDLVGLSGQHSGTRADQPVRIEARDLYFTGREYLEEPNATNLDKARRYFRKSVQIDPGYASAWAAMALTYAIWANDNTSDGPDAHNAQVQSAANRALAINSSLPVAHVALGLRYLQRWQWQKAQREYQSALRLDPYSAPAQQWYAHYLWFTGHSRQALVHMRLALASDPRSAGINADLGRALTYAGEIQQAQTRLLANIAARPDFQLNYEYLIENQITQHQFRQALESGKAVETMTGQSDPLILTEMGVADAGMGQYGMVRQYLARLQRQAAIQHVSSVFTALLYWELNDRQHAFKELRRAAQEHDQNLVIVSGPDWAQMRTDPRFAAIRRLMGLPTEAILH